MSEDLKFITLKKSDPKFKKYLWGNFSSNHIAIPTTELQNYHLLNEKNEITFEVIEKSQILRPSWLTLINSLLKFKSLFFTLIPILYVYVKNDVDDRLFDLRSFIFGCLSLQMLFWGFNLKNDINDYVSGFDKVFSKTKSKPILRGWIKAADVRFLSWVMIILSLMLAMPVFINQPEEIRVVAVVFVLILIGQIWTKNTYKNQILSELILFILIGPGIISGLQVALGSGIDTECLAFGLVWGWAAWFLVHIRNFEQVMILSQLKINNSITRLGFDRSKHFLIFWWLIFIALWAIYHYLYTSTFWGWSTTGILIFWSLPTFIKISEIQSPVGSNLNKIKWIGYKNFGLMVFILSAELVWYLLTKNSWTL